jgi:peroxiredoxin
MAWAVGDKVPDIAVQTMVEGRPKTVQTAEVLGKGKVVLFAVPGAFAPGCSLIHLPGYVQNAAALRDKGVDTIACIAVNDVFVMDAWGQAHDVGDQILMLADVGGDFAKAIGLELDGTQYGLGQRSQRYAAVVEDGILRELLVEPDAHVNLSTCDNLLTKL